MAKTRSWAGIWAKGMAKGIKAMRRSGEQVRKSMGAAPRLPWPGLAPLPPSRQRSSLRSARPKRAGAAPVTGLPAQATGRPPGAGRGTGSWLRRRVTRDGQALAYWLYKPAQPAVDGPAPVLVMLHGCGQDAAGFATSTRMNQLADRTGCLVLYPQQSRLANPHRCWNWFDSRSGRAQQEVALVLAALDQVLAAERADPLRVAVAGLSAGASLAALLATLAPHRVAAVVMHSGVPPGLSDSTLSALRAMQGRRRAAPGRAAAPADGQGEPPVVWPPLLVIHGHLDGVVAESNAHAAVALWADAAGGAVAGPSRRVQRGQRYATTLTDHRAGGRLVARLAIVSQLGHAWSGGGAGQAHSDPGGPDASAMVWAFAKAAFGA